MVAPLTFRIHGLLPERSAAGMFIRAPRFICSESLLLGLVPMNRDRNPHVPLVQSGFSARCALQLLLLTTIKSGALKAFLRFEGFIVNILLVGYRWTATGFQHDRMRQILIFRSDRGGSQALPVPFLSPASSAISESFIRQLFCSEAFDLF